MAGLAWSGEGTRLGRAHPRTHRQLVGHPLLCFVRPALSPTLWTGPPQVIRSRVRGRPRPRPRGVSLGDTSPNITDCTPASPALLTGPREKAPKTDPSAGSGRAQDPGCAARLPAGHPSTSGSGTQRLGPRGSYCRLRPSAGLTQAARRTPTSHHAPFCCPFSHRRPSEPSPPAGFLCPAWGLWPPPLSSLPRLGVQPIGPGRWQPARLGSWSQAKPRLRRVI